MSGNLSDRGFLDWTQVGENPDVDKATVPEAIWPLGGVYPFPAAAAATDIVSDSADDAAAGTGARFVQVTGLDAEYRAIVEIVQMDGVTPVTLKNQFLRINRVQVGMAGSAGSNVGEIIVRHPGPVTIGVIRPDTGRSQMAIYTVGDNIVEQAWLTQVFTSLLGEVAGSVTLAIQARPFGGAWVNFGAANPGATGGLFKIALDPWAPLARRTDLRIRAVFASTVNLSVMAGFQIVIRPRRDPRI